MKTNSRGSSVLEALPVVLLLAAFVAGLFLAAYLLFARAWIQYQAEQALYCVVEERGSIHCHAQLQSQLEKFLAWGQSHSRVSGRGANAEVEIEWKYQNYAVKVHRELNPKLILSQKALRW